MKTKKLLYILLLFIATGAGAQNIWRAPSQFNLWANFSGQISQNSGTDSVYLLTTAANSTLVRDSAFVNMSNVGAQIGNRYTNGFLVNANDTKIELQKNNKDTIQITFTDGAGETDTATFFGKHNIAAWVFNPPLTSTSVTGFWKTTGNTGTNPATDFLGTTDAQPFIIASDNYAQAAFGNTSSFGESDTAVLLTGDTGTFTFTQIEIVGQLKIVDGTEGNGKIFTSSINGTGSWSAPSINTTAGDAATINSTAGRFRKDATGSTFTLTNSYITTNSIIQITYASDPGITGFDYFIVAGVGSAVITFTTSGVAAAPTNNTDVNFFVIN